MIRRGILRAGGRIGRLGLPSQTTSTSAVLHSRLLQLPHSPPAGSATSFLRAWFSSYPSHEIVGLPALSPTMESGTIASWNKQEGDTFGPGDVICSVETDKATVDFEAQDDGVLAKILAPAGSDEIVVGAPIMVTVEDVGDVAAFKDYVLKESAAAASPPPAAAAAAPAPSAPAPAPVAPPSAAPTPAPAGGRVVASPLAHMIAKDMGYDISTIPGTGPGGRIIADDVREFVPSEATVSTTAVPAPAPAPAQAQAAMATATPIPGTGFTDYPISESAKEVAARLAQSKRNVPHYYLTVDISMDALLTLRKELSAAVGEESSLGVYEMVIKAAAKSMKAVPSANASWMESVVRVFDSVDMNVVVGTGDKLYTPVIRDCGAKGIKGISDELNAAVSAVESGELTPEFASMGTFTIMNLGMYGIKSCAPIIREPQACALALGTLENRIVPNDDPDSEQIYKESVMMTATLSCDHRVVDGAVGAQWLSAFKTHLESPSTLLL
ncbi:dihydrolipoamide acetyl transferase [Nitzschia inconspicua]|uniref:Dihydrolipoamide acetyltransferase component of pyruvate dehydrogenase complex n=1 Tax=Nitzschia inconspicua TaxID=303405 RepID=A0A9K3LL29_9STRA|nr:dihydrolipoamide acetyl transferase [Nitzschia inconspicua]